ncbi:MAG TPA: DNA replication and repair protein RecF [bacterium]|nr:DNA replication and repair protein RecF [bacterium]
MMQRLRRLWLRAFRNYERADLTVGPGTTAFVGPNAAGKSNLLESIYLVATGRSHRTVREGDVIRSGETSARVRAFITRGSYDEDLDITLVAEGGRESVQMRVNGAVTPRSGVLGRLPVVLAAPWDLDVVRGPAGGRRRLLNGALAQLSPAYHFAMHRYHRVVAQRNMALRQRSADGLQPWDVQMIALGCRITARRREYVQRLAAAARVLFEQLAGEGRLDVAYRPAWDGHEDAEIADTARVELSRWRADELRRGVSLTGPHRDDLELRLNGALLRTTGSQGEWRAAMLALRFAERAVMADELGAPPLLLLDDALAELDSQRQRRVLDMGGEAQVLLTVTDLPDAGSAKDALIVVAVDAGRLVEGAWSHRFDPS